ncbi:hypothetical protein OEZ85_002438 [Tetradesmus obliquus]|uniref:Uncharacterized protein n=1 Tax=Tetradesmus obliquus TaxID=3088 RepID=A0ABY8U063_TETOB|nr:hypothetical protein OEZ85_002438 [Tetradesmus obliquus]
MAHCAPLCSRPALLWPASFLLGIAVFAPLEALVLCIDYYSESFPGAQAAVKLSATYDAMLTLTQLACYCCEAWVRKYGRGRILWRHSLVAGLLCLLVVYDRVIVGEVLPPPGYALPLLIVITALIGALDGISIGAVYGEVGIAGPGPAQAVVAGHSTGFLLLVALRVVTKLALPATREGTRISVCIYFAATGLLVLAAAAAYLLVLRPAVAAAASDRLESRMAKALDVVPFGATYSRASGLRFRPCPSARGVSLSMRLVHTGLPPATLNSMRGSMSVSPSLLAGTLPQYSQSVKFFGSSKSHAAAGVAQPGSGDGVLDTGTLSPKAAAAAAGLGPLVLHSRSTASSAASSALQSSGAGSGALPASPRATSLKAPHKAAAAAAKTKKRITFDVPEDAEEEQREAAEEAAAQGLIELAGNAAAKDQEAVCSGGSSGVKLLKPTNTLAEGLPDAPGPAAAGVLAAAAGKLAEGAAKCKAADTKGGATGSERNDVDRQQQQLDQDEAVAWATVVEKDGARGEEASPFVADQADEFSPFQVVHMKTLGRKLFGAIKSMKSGKMFGASGFFSSSRFSAGLTASSRSSTGSRRPAGITLRQLSDLKSGKLKFEDVVNMSLAAPEPKYALPGRSVAAVTASILRDSWAFCLGILLSYLGQFLVLPAILGFVAWPAVGSWYPLLLQVTQGLGDLAGKLLPVWEPNRPQATMAGIATARMALVPAIVLGLAFDAGPGFFFPMVFALLVSAWYETSIFAMACSEGGHPDDVYVVESLLAFMIQAGSLSGALLSMALSLGPWAAAAAAAAEGGGGHGGGHGA